MSCNGCRTTVENALNSIDGITAAVSLNPPVATLTMEKHIPIEKLQQALTTAGNYMITMANPTDNPQSEGKPAKNSCC